MNGKKLKIASGKLKPISENVLQTFVLKRTKKKKFHGKNRFFVNFLFGWFAPAFVQKSATQFSQPITFSSGGFELQYVFSKFFGRLATVALNLNSKMQRNVPKTV
jgi:hypothetical protein